MKKLIFVILLLISVQFISFAQQTRHFKISSVEQESYENKVIVKLEAGHFGRDNGCLIENTSDSWIEVSYDITFVKASPETIQLEKSGMDISGVIQEVSKSGTIRLAPAGTPRQKGKPSARYWVTAGEGQKVNFERTKISITATQIAAQE